jgi:glycosyltransferase involved in cell wall biosynthesis
MKGVDVLLQAVRDLRKKRKDFRLLLTADTSFNEDYIETTGWLEPVKVREILTDSDIYVMPSLWREPFGIGLIEAMACGVPVIASDGPGTSQIVVDETSGYLFPPGDSSALSDRLDKLLDNGRLRRNFGRAGRSRVEENFAWDKIIDEHYLKEIFTD